MLFVGDAAGVAIRRDRPFCFRRFMEMAVPHMAITGARADISAMRVAAKQIQPLLGRAHRRRTLDGSGGCWGVGRTRPWSSQARDCEMAETIFAGVPCRLKSHPAAPPEPFRSLALSKE